MYKSSLRHTHDPVLSSLMMEGIRFGLLFLQPARSQRVPRHWSLNLGFQNQHRLKDTTAPRTRRALHTSPMSGQRDQILLNTRIRRVSCTAQSYRCWTRESLHETTWSLQDFGPGSTKYRLIIIPVIFKYLRSITRSGGSQRSRTALRVCTLLTGAY
jgi:hypothetical protein